MDNYRIETIFVKIIFDNFVRDKIMFEICQDNVGMLE